MIYLVVCYSLGTATKFAPGTVPERPADAVGAEQIGGPIWAEPIHDMDFIKVLYFPAMIYPLPLMTLQVS